MNSENRQKLKQAVELLKLAVDLDDAEILRTTIASVIEIIEEISQ